MLRREWEWRNESRNEWESGFAFAFAFLLSAHNTHDHVDPSDSSDSMERKPHRAGRVSPMSQSSGTILKKKIPVLVRTNTIVYSTKSTYQVQYWYQRYGRNHKHKHKNLNFYDAS
jgi:hypothetical protein